MRASILLVAILLPFMGHSEVVSEHNEFHTAFQAAIKQLPDCHKDDIVVVRKQKFRVDNTDGKISVFSTNWEFSCRTVAPTPDPTPNPGPTPGPDPTPQPEPPISYAAGVAPLGVHFDAGEWSFDKTFTWDFGDDRGLAWSTTGKPKNSDTGPIAAHIYDEPGSYTATLTVSDDNGVISVKQYAVLVGDQNAAFPNDRTVCLTTVAESDFSGCPNGAIKTTTDDISVIHDYIDSNRRILLDRGSVWNTTGSAIASRFREFSGVTDVVIGAYGDCIEPDARGACVNDPVINMPGSGKYPIFELDNNSHWKFLNLSIIGDANSPGLFGGRTNLSHIMAYRIKSEGHGVAFGNGHYATSDHHHIFAIDNYIKNGQNYGLYLGANQLALMGNVVQNSRSSHVVRVWQAYKGVISHNGLSGASLDNDNGRNALKLHGPKESYINATDGSQLEHRTEFVVLSNNTFGASGPWPVSIGPQDPVTDERLSNILVVDNRFLAGHGENSSRLVRTHLHVWARDVVVSSNLFDADGANDASYTAVGVSQHGVEPAPDNVLIVGNAVKLSDKETYRNGVEVFVVGEDCRNISIIGNRSTLPKQAVAPVIMIEDNSPNLIQSDNIFE